MHALPIIIHHHDSFYYKLAADSTRILLLFRSCFNWRERGSKDAPTNIMSVNGGHVQCRLWADGGTGHRSYTQPFQSVVEDIWQYG